MWTEPLFQNFEPADKHWQYTQQTAILNLQTAHDE